jgi:TonB family protein
MPVWLFIRIAALLISCFALKVAVTSAQEPVMQTPDAPADSLHSQKPIAVLPPPPELHDIAAHLLKHTKDVGCRKNDCKILVTNFALPDGHTSPYGIQLADRLSQELATQDPTIQIVNRKSLESLLDRERIPSKLMDDIVFRELGYALHATAVVLGTLKRVNDGTVKLSAHMLGVTDPGISGNAEAKWSAPQGSVDLSTSENFQPLPALKPNPEEITLHKPGVDGYSPPKCANTPSPSYTEAARAVKLNGTAITEAIINTNGQLESIRIVRGLPHGLNEATIAKMKTWQCNPAQKDGKPVAVPVQFEVKFALY